MSARDRGIEVEAASDAVDRARVTLKRMREGAAAEGGPTARRARCGDEGILCSAEVSL